VRFRWRPDQGAPPLRRTHPRRQGPSPDRGGAQTDAVIPRSRRPRQAWAARTCAPSARLAPGGHVEVAVVHASEHATDVVRRERTLRARRITRRPLRGRDARAADPGLDLRTIVESIVIGGSPTLIRRDQQTPGSPLGDLSKRPGASIWGDSIDRVDSLTRVAGHVDTDRLGRPEFLGVVTGLGARLSAECRHVRHPHQRPGGLNARTQHHRAPSGCPHVASSPRPPPPRPIGGPGPSGGPHTGPRRRTDRSRERPTRPFTRGAKGHRIAFPAARPS